jgi:hypothetical protein
LFCDSGSSGRLVTSDHDDLNTGGLTLLDSEGHGLLGRIHQRNQTNKDEVIHGEVEVVW